MNIESLEGITTGLYVVTTCSGTKHFLDLDAKASIRRGAAGREWGEELLVVHPFAMLAGAQPKLTVSFEKVTPDGAPFFYDSIRDVTVGERMRLDNADEWRVTSEIQSIEAWEGE